MVRPHPRVDHPYPREYAALEPDVALLRALAAATGGANDPPTARMFDAGGESLRHRAPVWRYPVGLAVGMLLVDLLLRRVRIFDRGFRPREMIAPRGPLSAGEAGAGGSGG